MEPHLWREFALNIVLHSLAGGLTDTVAVWMLFNPHKPFMGVQGAIPKNKARLASSIGKVVGEKLLTPDDMLKELTHGGIRDAFNERVASVVQSLLETERGSLRSLVPDSMSAELESALQAVAATVAERVETWAESEEARPTVIAFVARLRDAIGDQTLSDVLPAARRAALMEQGRSLAMTLSHSDTVASAVAGSVRAQAESLLTRDEPLLKTMPAELSAMLDKAVDAYIPVAVDKLGVWLSQGESRERVKRTLQGLMSRFVTELRFHERVLARFLVTERALEKALDALGGEGVDELSSLLREPAIREQVTRAVRDGVESLLRKPLKDIVGAPDADRVTALSAGLSNGALRLLRAESTQAFVADKIEAAFEGMAHRRLDDLLAGVSDETIAGWVLEGLRGEATQQFVRDTAARVVQKALDAPIGRPARWLPAHANERLAAVLAPAIWDWIVTSLPSLVQKFDVPALIERKVNEFSTERVEEIVRGVTQRELNLIIKFGFVLGAFIGVGTFFISQAIRALP
ncbi:MAG: DUF445 family protein [Gemmatimonadota bacterium]